MGSPTHAEKERQREGTDDSRVERASFSVIGIMFHMIKFSHPAW